MDCFQLRVKAGNDGQRAALRSRRWEMRDCDGGCAAVPLAAAVERRRRRGPKGKRLRVGPLRTRHKRLPVRVWPPATNKKQFHCLGTSHKSTHAHTVSQSAWGPELHLFEPTLGSHPQKQNTAHKPFRSQFVLASGEACAALCWEFCEGLFALDVQPKRRSGLCVGGMCSSLLRHPPFENAGGSVGDGKSPHLASFHPPT